VWYCVLWTTAMNTALVTIYIYIYAYLNKKKPLTLQNFRWYSKLQNK
jgi:hypothetical protein